MRTPRGRVATRHAYQHCGLKPPKEGVAALAGSADLFDEDKGEEYPH